MPETYKTAFPDCMVLPADPQVPLTPEQLATLFPNREANKRVWQMIVRDVLGPQFELVWGDEIEADAASDLNQHTDIPE